MIKEEGPWSVVFGNGNTYIESDDFTHDAHLCILGDFESAEQRVEYAEEIARRLNTFATAQDEINEQARIVGMGAEREIDLRQKLDIVSSLLREASGRMSYGHWSSEFRERVESALKTKELKEQITNTQRCRNADDMGDPPANAAEMLSAWKTKT